MASKFSKISALLFFLIIFSLIAPMAYAQQEPIDIVYFYGKTCPHCATFQEWLDEIKDEYSINPIGFEVYSNKSNLELARELAEEYGESFRSVPMIFICDQTFVGFNKFVTGKEIIQKLESCIQTHCQDSPLDKIKQCEFKPPVEEKLSVSKILALAAVDAINPCALAVLALLLIAIITYNPDKKRKVLQAGLAFTFSVFIMYLFYGLIIIKSFQLVQAISLIRVWLYKILGIAAILFGILNIKDFFHYKPGGIATEMPISMRPALKKILSRVTSPKGAFLVGLLVTVFLLPCTIGPYVIAGGILSTLEFFKTIPWLLIYNFVFVLPMVLITLLVYWEMTKVEDISGWKDKNIKWLHLVAGIIILGLGIAMLFGLV